MKLRAHTAATILSDKHHVCTESTAWIRSLPPDTTARQAWQLCQRGDWMLWLLGRLSDPPESDARKRLVLCTCECARLAIVHVPTGEDRPRIAVETAEAWARGQATIKQVIAASADSAYAAYAAYAAAYAAYAASAAGAACAANSAAYAAYAADSAAARTKALATCADIVRTHYPHAPHIRGKGESK